MRTDTAETATAPIGLALDRPHSARIYDYFLGGKDNYEADRQAAQKVKRAWPSVELAARTNREFMARATRYSAREMGIRQFLDVGTGIPTEPNLHQIAQEITSDARVVYVDNDPVVLAHSRALLVSSAAGRTACLDADVRDPRAILDSAEVRDTLDLNEPIALSLIALMHFILDNDDPHGIVDRLMNALAPGSVLVMNHVTGDFDKTAIAEATQVYLDNGISAQARSREEFAAFFHGLDVVEPGLTVPHRWRPRISEIPNRWDRAVSCYSAVARKPG